MQRGPQSMQRVCLLTAARQTPHQLPIQQVSFRLTSLHQQELCKYKKNQQDFIFTPERIDICSEEQ